MRKSNLCYTLLIHIINDLLDTGRKSMCIRHSEDVLKLTFIKKTLSTTLSQYIKNLLLQSVLIVT